MVHMTRRMTACAACAVLMAAMACAPAMAAETVPLIAGTQSMQPDTAQLGSLEDYKLVTRLRGVTVGREPVRQARVSGLSIGLRLFSASGEALQFRQRLAEAETGVCLVLQATQQQDTMTMQLDEHALTVLGRVGATKIVVADEKGDVRAMYDTAELAAAREFLGLAADEQLCVGRDDEPVTIIGVDGVRRQANP